MEFVLLTGMSGAGKSRAANVLEDMGFYCVDNMPSVLIPKFTEICTQSQGKLSRIAFVIDVRGENEFERLFHQIYALGLSGHTCRTIFLDCSDEVLINRHKETRRMHPLVPQYGSIQEAILAERKILEPAKKHAEYVINTTNLTPMQLKERITAIFSDDKSAGVVVTCFSFGFKYGPPLEADLVFDVRCFPNPFYIESMRKKTGFDPEVHDFVMDNLQMQGFIRRLYDMIDYLMPLYVEEGKTQLIVAVGCTGGRHRSVTVANELSEHLKENGFNTIVIHRDIDK